MADGFEVAVVGGGPAGVTAALRARELGASVALVERGNLGGTCTNDGCVPTRVLAHAARLRRDAEQFADYGLISEPPKVDFTRLLNRTQHIVYEVHEKKQLRSRLEGSGIRVFHRAGDAVSPSRTRSRWETGRAWRRRRSSCALADTPGGCRFPALSTPSRTATCGG